MTPAWAVLKGETILVHTVYATRLGAIRNWLCTDAGMLLKATAPDEVAETLWERFSKRDGVTVSEIEMRVLHEAL